MKPVRTIANKKNGGCVHLDLSHEIYYTNWIFKNLKKKIFFLEGILT